jgi:hypothetical protein
MAYEKKKFTFTLDGIKYTNISGYTYGNDDKYNINVAGTAQMIRQWMKSKYPSIPIRDYYWVNSKSFSMGDSIDVYLNDAPEEFYIKLNKELNAKFEEGTFDGMTDSYTYTKRPETSSEGKIIDYGTKYLFVNNKKPYDSDAGAVDWSVLQSKPTTKPSTTTKPTTTRSSYSMGEVLMDCSGWIISKKTLPDGRIVYNAKIKPDTPANKADWNTIKGEIYTETGFKWGKFYAFEKWGSLSDEAERIQKLCNVLGKYYNAGQTNVPAPTPAPAPAPTPTNNNPQSTWVENTSYLSIPANPKLEFVRINDAEGDSPYIDSFPKDFTSFTALTKYIADNIIDFPTDGTYDKHFITWKWKFDTDDRGDRWDIGEGQDNPKKYSNLYAYLEIRLLCYDAWKSKSLTAEEYAEYDNFFANQLGKDGLEISDAEFNSILSELIIEYGVDSRLFKYNTPEEQIERFKECYPQLYGNYNKATTTPSKEDIQKAIVGLQYLADKGNEEARKAIIGLTYLLNK